MPRRPYGSQLSDSNPSQDQLPDNVPIVGLGCSSFSKFFQATEDDPSKKEKNKIEQDNEDIKTDLSWVTLKNPHVQEWIETIIYAVEECGINLLDTAPWYGHGSSEIVIGYAMEKMLGNDTKKLSQKMRREDIILNTKVGRYESNPKYMFDFSGRRVMDSVKLSIQRMKCQYIDVLQLHDPEFAPSIDLLLEETIPQMAQMRKMGLVKAIGITGYPLSIQKEIIERSWKELGIKFDQSLTYGHFNLHDQSLISPYPHSIEHKLHDGVESTLSFADYVLQERSMGLICAAPLSMGLLTKSGPPAWHPASSTLKLACLEASQLCEENSVNISKLAIAFSLSNSDISCTLLGMKSIEEVNMAMDAAIIFSDESEEEKKREKHSHPGELNFLYKNLSSIELKTLKQILDKKHGPFKKVYMNGEFEWDGIHEANIFWNQLEGGRKEGETRMRGK